MKRFFMMGCVAGVTAMVLLDILEPMFFALLSVKAVAISGIRVGSLIELLIVKCVFCVVGAYLLSKFGDDNWTLAGVTFGSYFILFRILPKIIAHVWSDGKLWLPSSFVVNQIELWVVSIAVPLFTVLIRTWPLPRIAQGAAIGIGSDLTAQFIYQVMFQVKLGVTGVLLLIWSFGRLALEPTLHESPYALFRGVAFGVLILSFFIARLQPNKSLKATNPAQGGR